MSERNNRQPSFEELCLYDEAWAVLTDPNNDIKIIQDWNDPNSEAIVICSGYLRSKKPGQTFSVELESYLFEGNATFAFWPQDNSEQFIISRGGVEVCNENGSYSHLTDDEKIKLIRFWLQSTNWIKIEADDPMGSEQQP